MTAIIPRRPVKMVSVVADGPMMVVTLELMVDPHELVEMCTGCISTSMQVVRQANADKMREAEMLRAVAPSAPPPKADRMEAPDEG